MSTMNEENVRKVVDVLNKARSMELHSIQQYMNQHYNLDDKDYGKFAANIKRIAIDEMTHAENFAERIKNLDGEPTSELSEKVKKGQELKAIYPYNIELEENVIHVYNQFARICRENNDNVSAKLFENTLEDEQKHYDYFDNINKHISELGNAFLAKIAGTRADIGDSEMGFVHAMNLKND